MAVPTGCANLLSLLVLRLKPFVGTALPMEFLQRLIAHGAFRPSHYQGHRRRDHQNRFALWLAEASSFDYAIFGIGALRLQVGCL